MVAKEKLSAAFTENPVQRAGAAAVRSLNSDVVPLGFLHSTVYHFVSCRSGKENNQIRLSDLFLQIALHSGKNFSLAFIFFADLFIFALHTLISAYNHNAHLYAPFPGFEIDSHLQL